MDEVDSGSRQLNYSGTNYVPSDVQATPAPAIRKKKTLSIRKLTSNNVLSNPGVSRDEREYFMGNKERGVALIFSHEHFDERESASVPYRPSSRSGTQFDRDTLCRAFENLGFQVRCFDDFCHYQITNELRRVAKQNHKKRDCLVVAVLSHGERNGMLDAMDREYHVSELWEPFTARQCPTLAGKPKLFFIQACKGPAVDRGVSVTSIVADASSDVADAALTYPVPCYADILVSYSTFEGLYSFRNPQNGAWYIQTLCNQLETYGTTKDLVSLLTDVNRIVGQRFRSHSDTEPDYHGLVQSPSFTSSLTRRLCFSSGRQPLRTSSSTHHCSEPPPNSSPHRPTTIPVQASKTTKRRLWAGLCCTTRRRHNVGIPAD